MTQKCLVKKPAILIWLILLRNLGCFHFLIDLIFLDLATETKQSTETKIKETNQSNIKFQNWYRENSHNGHFKFFEWLIHHLNINFDMKISQGPETTSNANKICFFTAATLCTYINNVVGSYKVSKPRQ